MKTTTDTVNAVAAHRLNANGRPIVFSYFGGAHGYCGEYLTADSRIGFIKRDGDTIRDARSADRLCSTAGTLISLP